MQTPSSKLPIPSIIPPFRWGDQVYVSSPHMVPSASLSSKWAGPFKGILTTPTAAKLQGHLSWVHIFRLKLQTPSFHSTLTGPTSLRTSCLSPNQEKEEILNP
jgi:hypothetical protein